jgi:hypothetical protein
VWDRGEYQAAPAADHGTLRRKMGLALVFGAPDEIETGPRPESVADLAQRQFNHAQYSLLTVLFRMGSDKAG